MLSGDCVSVSSPSLFIWILPAVHTQEERRAGGATRWDLPTDESPSYRETPEISPRELQVFFETFQHIIFMSS